MDPKDPSPSAPGPGLYDRLVSRELAERMALLKPPLSPRLVTVPTEDAHTALAQYVARVLVTGLASFRGDDSADGQRRLVNDLIASLAGLLGDTQASAVQLTDPLSTLQQVHDRSVTTGFHLPTAPLSRSAMFTGTRLDPALHSQLLSEIATADYVDILCAFIKWSGLRLLLPAIRQLTNIAHPDRPRVRVITTSYMGATEPRAIEALRDLPNTEVRVSYDTEHTRLHAKAYMIHRETGFGSAYVGSANMTRPALSAGLEWTTKISQFELPYLWNRVIGTFETYWNDDEFEPFVAGCENRFRAAIAREKTDGGTASSIPLFDLRPHPFQEEILETLAAEREVQGKTAQLIVAATGTGKTMIAAFDYRRWAGGRASKPPLLFIAHREEILRQSLAVFRAVLRDQNFGDLLVGGASPQQRDHLFCSIQSYNSQELWRLPAERYAYVVVDEFHHAAAPSYRRLLDHVQPNLLLGLTATPERTDALDILHWFGGKASAEIRLADAISRQLLCPFHYFGVTDSVDLQGLKWQRGGYRTEDLDHLYTGNDIRAELVLAKVHELVGEPTTMRALGFCVSVAHANFMARFMTARGLPSIALSAESSETERLNAAERLRRRELALIFVVDLYNEGVDIPEVDTILFLRPTESLTVFLQQLGRGLRRHDDKSLTVLDFIGQQHREFRFAARFRALATASTLRVDEEVEAGFPHLPPGCAITLERVAQERVLQNIRDALSLHRSRIVAELRSLAAEHKRPPTLDEAAGRLTTDLTTLLQRGLWSRLLADAGAAPNFDDPDESVLAKGLRRLSHIDDPQLIEFLRGALNSPAAALGSSELDERRRSVLQISLWGASAANMTLREAEDRLQQNPTAKRDVISVLEFQRNRSRVRPYALAPSVSGPLALHACYTRNEILVGLGHWTFSARPEFREGTLHLKSSKVDAFFVTLNKTDGSYSPTTMYEDYAINDRLFHWQSQSTTSIESETGRRYVRHRDLGYTPLLFVRENRELSGGLAAPYVFLGPADHVSHEGSRPISIVWRLRSPMPARLLRTTAMQAVI